MTQLALDLQPRRAPARELPAIDRLRAVLKRQGFSTGYRDLKGSVLLRPLLASRNGWQCMCGHYGCGTTTFERVDYCDREPLTGADREAWAWWRENEWRASVYELWGKP